MSAQYVVRPRADSDLDDLAYYFATEATSEIGHRFLVAAHETFALLATQPEMGWRSRLKNPALTSLRIFRMSGFTKILVLYRPQPGGVEIRFYESCTVPEICKHSCVAKALNSSGVKTHRPASQLSRDRIPYCTSYCTIREGPQILDSGCTQFVA